MNIDDESDKNLLGINTMVSCHTPESDGVQRMGWTCSQAVRTSIALLLQLSNLMNSTDVSQLLYILAHCHR